MGIVSALFGRPLATSESRQQEIGVLTGVPVLGLDALSSASYGPEAALAILIPAGVLGLEYMPAIIAVILVLLAMLYFLTGRPCLPTRMVVAPISSRVKTLADTLVSARLPR
jgi:hypothetical protein